MKLSEISLSTDNLHLPGMVRQALLKPTDISPLSAYYTLKELLGSPNGSIDEAKSQWAYCRTRSHFTTKAHEPYWRKYLRR